MKKILSLLFATIITITLFGQDGPWKQLGTSAYDYYVSNSFRAGATLQTLGEIEFPVTSSASVGTINQNNIRVFHLYGTDNIFIGKNAGNYTTTGTGANIGIGTSSFGLLGADALKNTAMGYQSGFGMTTGDENTFYGFQAGRNLNTGEMNTAIGAAALYSPGVTHTAKWNTAVGHTAGYAITSGQSNAIFGFEAGIGLTTGSNNVLLGESCAESLTTGSGNIVIGQNIDAVSGSQSNALNIGNLIKGDLSLFTTYINGNFLALGGLNTEGFNFHIEEDARVEAVLSGYSATKTVLAIRRSNGTMASPSAILNTEIIGDLSWGGYKTDAWSVSSVAAIQAVATEDYDNTGTGTKLIFQTTPNNTTGVVDQFIINQDGNIQIEEKVTEYNNIALVQDGLPHSVAEVNLTGQTAAIAATTIYTAPADGKYLLVWTAKVTTAATTSSALGPFQYKFTEADYSQVVTAPPGNTNNINQTSANSITTGYLSGSYAIHADAGTAIQYIMGYTTSGATPMAYNLHLLLYKL